MPATAKMTDTQNGRKRIDNKSTKKDKIRSIITLSYTLYPKIQTKGTELIL